MSAARIMPVSPKIEAAHVRKHAKSPRDWCPLCAGSSPAPQARTPKRTPAPAPERNTRPEVPAEVVQAAKVLSEFARKFDIRVNGDILRALAQEGVRTAPERKRTRRPGVVPSGHPVSRNGHPLRGAALANHWAKADRIVRDEKSVLDGNVEWADGDVLVPVQA